VPRPKTKTIAATVRLSPEVRAAWEAAATHERRSLTSMLEVALLEYVKRHRIPVAPHADPSNDNS
jgi:hypothetical protein